MINYQNARDQEDLGPQNNFMKTLKKLFQLKF